MKGFFLTIILYVLATATVSAQMPKPPGDAGRGSDTIAALADMLADDPDNIDMMVEICSQYTIKGEYEGCLRYARRLRETGVQCNDERALMYGDLYTGQSYLLTNHSDSIRYYLDRALERALELDDRRALSTTYNCLGIYATGIGIDYHGGIEYFLKAMEYASDMPDRKFYLIPLCNLAMAYYMRNDPAGLKYAEEVYEIGTSTEDEYIVFGGAVISAYMHHMSGENETAKEYVEKIIHLSDKYNYHAEIYSLYANVLNALGDDVSAEQYYKKALEYIDAGVVTAASMTYLNYATYLIEHNRIEEALPLLERGIAISTEKNNAVQRYLLYKRMSEAQRKLGHHERALVYFEAYHNEADSIFNLERERSINELRVKYEAERQENELKQNRITLIQEQKKLQLSALLLVILLGTLAVIYILYQRKNKMYRQIVRQQHEFVRKEKRLTDSGILGRADAPDSAAGQQKDEQTARNSELFAKLEYLMGGEKIYRRNDLNIDKLAEKLATNRTYLSRTINQQAGMTFYSYINSYRIDEAMRTLSDFSNDIPLKVLASSLGYNSLQTFYAAFQGIIGMPPSKYREKLMELYRKNAL